MMRAERMLMSDSEADAMRRRRITDDAVTRGMSSLLSLLLLSQQRQQGPQIQQTQQKQQRQPGQPEQQRQPGQQSQPGQPRQLRQQQTQQRQQKPQEQRFGCRVVGPPSRSFIPLARCLVLLLLFVGIEPRSATDHLSSPLNKEARACNTTSNGRIYSDGHYAPMMLHSVALPVHVTSFCFYRFLGSPEQRIWIQIQRLVTGYYDYSSRSCRDGYLRVFDGSPEPGNHRYPPFTFCGQYDHLNATVFTSGHVAVVELHSQSDVISAYVVAVFKYVNIDSESATFPRQIDHSMDLLRSTAYMCAWRVTVEDCSDDECPLLSPGYPGAYPPTMECGYHISSRDGDKAIQVKFHGMNSRHKPREFDVRTTDDCREEYLEIYDGNSTTSPRIGRFCGTTMPDMTSSGSHLYVLFVSGPDTPRYGNIGFHCSVLGLTIEWHGGGQKAANRLCDWTFNVSEGSVSSPDHWLPKQTKCSYIFHVHLRHRLDVVLNIYGLSSSCGDYVEIHEGDRMVERFCDRATSDGMQGNVDAATEAEDQHPEDADEDGDWVHRYSFRKTPVRISYFTTSGQMQASPKRGFWLSYKQIRSDGSSVGGSSAGDESHRPLASAKGDHRRMTNDEQLVPDYDQHHHRHQQLYPTNSASSSSSSFLLPFFSISYLSFLLSSWTFFSNDGHPWIIAFPACLASGHFLIFPLLPILFLHFHLYHHSFYFSQYFSIYLSSSSAHASSVSSSDSTTGNLSLSSTFSTYSSTSSFSSSSPTFSSAASSSSHFSACNYFPATS